MHKCTDTCFQYCAYLFKKSCGRPCLLLDAVVIPIAEGSSNQCNLAEKSQTDKRLLKISLEKQVETVRDFWRNKVVEGDSRSGRMFRNALITKTESHFGQTTYLIKSSPWVPRSL